MDLTNVIELTPNRNVPVLEPGDTVRVSSKVVEGTRERIQVFEGVVIRVQKGKVDSNFTVRRIASHGVGVERTFFFYSPRVDKVEVVRHGTVRRAKLYYLRGLTGKAARLRERMGARPGVIAVPVAALPAEEAEEFEPELAVTEPAQAEAVEPMTAEAEASVAAAPAEAVVADPEAEAHADVKADSVTPEEEAPPAGGTAPRA